MTESKRIAILTGGGDVPGLNAVIKSVVYRATEVGYSTLGIRRGWEGRTHLRPAAPPGETSPAAADAEGGLAHLALAVGCARDDVVEARGAAAAGQERDALRFGDVPRILQ